MAPGCPPGWTVPATGPTAGVCNWQGNNPDEPPPNECPPHAPFALPDPSDLRPESIQVIRDAVAWAKTCNVYEWPELASPAGRGDQWCMATTNENKAKCVAGVGPSFCVIAVRELGLNVPC